MSWQKMRTDILAWFDGETMVPTNTDATRVNLLRCLPFIAVHLGCLAVFWVGWSPVAVGVALGLYLVRMFAITGFYHRYFSHRSFKCGRGLQFVFAVIGCAAVQRGPLWWAAHHRQHHRHSDEVEDVHSPVQHGFLWSHFAWFTSDLHFPTHYDRVKDFLAYPELRWLNRYDMWVPLFLGVLVFVTGAGLAQWAPGLGTHGWQMLVWGFFLSTTVLWHVTFAVNSMAHLFGARPFATADSSRNNLWLALLTLGEGWHNNHHRFPGSARQGFLWWEIDLTYYGLKVFQALGWVWGLKPPPARILAERYRAVA